MMNDIKRIWATTRIELNMFEYISGRSFGFDAFYALEIHYMLQTMIADRKIVKDVTTLKMILEQLEQNTWIKNINKPIIPRLNLHRLDELNYKPLPFQLEFLNKYDETTQRYMLNGMLLAGSAGSGKTFTSLACAHCLDAQKVIIICPKVAVDRVWVDNITKVFKKTQKVWRYYTGKKYAGEKFVIYHYEALDKAIGDYRDYLNKNNCIILDESHNLNELSASRTQNFLSFCKLLECKDIILASGTPVKALATETLPLFKAIDPFFTDKVGERFKKIYRGESNKATEILTHRMNIVSFKVSKAELNLEPPIFYNIPVKIPNGEDYTLKQIAKDLAAYAEQQIKYYKDNKAMYEKIFYDYLDYVEKMLSNPSLHPNAIRHNLSEYKDYRDMLKKLIYMHDHGQLRAATDVIIGCNKYEREIIHPILASTEDRKKFAEVKTIVKYVKLKIQGECLGRVLGRKRIDAHVDMVKYIDYDYVLNSTAKKTVVFTSFVEVLEMANEILEDRKRFPLMVYGKQNSQLNAIVQKFFVDKNANPLIATYASLSTAVPLIAADTMLIINAPFRNYIFEQAVSRIHRLGSDTQTVVFMCHLDTGEEPNISSRHIDILKWSQSEVEKILGTGAAFKICDNPDIETPDLSYVNEEMSITELVKPEEIITVNPKQIPKPLFTDW